MKLDELKNANPDLKFIKHVQLKNIEELFCKGSLDVEYIQTSQPDGFVVALTDKENILEKIEFDVSDKRLKIKYKNAGMNIAGGVYISNSDNVSIISVKGVNVVSGSNITIINGDAIQLKIFVVMPNIPYIKLSGSGDVSAYDIKQENIELELSGSGDIEISGKVNHLRVNLMGSGDIDIEDLEAYTAQINLKGSGDINATVKEAVEANLMGSGDIRIYGNPEHRKTSKQGSGSIKFKK